MNAAKGREIVSGKFRRPGRPKKPIGEKEKPRTIRASDQFILQAKAIAEKQGFKGGAKGGWQTWLKSLALQQFEQHSDNASS